MGLEAIRQRHWAVTTDRGPGEALLQACKRCMRAWPCDAVTLLAEIDRMDARLRAEMCVAGWCKGDEHAESCRYAFFIRDGGD